MVSIPDAAEDRPFASGGRRLPEQAIDPAKVLRLMFAFFGDGEAPVTRTVQPHRLPAPYRSLLAHDGHLTEVLERHLGATLSVRPYCIRREGEIYGRRLDLRAPGDDKPVMTGIMIFNLARVGAAVREEIVRAEEPLGAILIRHDILRRVTPDAFLEFDPDDALVARFGLAAPRPAYGRLATINCDGNPVVDLLEIVRP